MGRIVLPTPALRRVDTDANEVFHVMSATNLAQALVECGAIKFLPV
jgi:hypothetical protein